MITLQNKNTFHFNEVRLEDKTISTLLVPAHLLDEMKTKTQNSLVVYLHNLLKMYRTLTHSGMIHPPRKIKTEYQEEGLNLRQLNFRPSSADWIELGELALAFGKSRCWMFTFLLELDILGLWEILLESGMEDAVPTKVSLRLKVSWSLRRVLPDFTRSYYVRV